jgi:inositol transport system permease protein
MLFNVNIDGQKLKKEPIKFIFKYGIYFLFIIITLFLVIFNNNFRDLTNTINVLLQVSSYAILGVGMTFVIITGGIDVSVGAVMVACTATYAVLTQHAGVSEPIGLIIMMLVALIFGVINGAAVAYLSMPPFLVTLATQCVGRGVALVLTGGVSYRDLGDSFSFMGKTKLFGVPLLIWVVAIVFIIGYLILHKTVYGRKVMAIGGNINAARVSGINVKRVTMSVYIILGVISGLSGFITAARIGSYYAAMGQGMEFMVIAAVVIGGTSLSGGVGSIIGTLVGTLLIGIINNALNLFGVPAEFQDVARGIVIFLAVLFDAIRNRFNFSD